MDQQEILGKTAVHVRQVLEADSSGHDWWHIHRVTKQAVQMAHEEGADPFVVELAALLHDIADWKFHGGDQTAGPRAARQWLEQLQVGPATIEHVCSIIARLSFKGAGADDRMSTLEGQIVQDADRLDAIGAIGVARAFAYGGHAGRAMHDPAVPPQRHDSAESYRKGNGPTINHFYEKLLLLRDRMNTPAGRRRAESRHDFLEQFLDQFLREWNVSDVDEDEDDER